MESDRIFCRKCGAENEKSGKFCRKCGADLYHVSQPNKPSIAWYILPILFSIIGGIIGYFVIRSKDEKMAKNILYVGLGIFVLGILITAVPSPSPVDTEDRISTPAPTPDVITVDAWDLYFEYSTNEIAADAKYKGKIVNVDGVVHRVDRDILGAPYITLETSGFGLIQCMFDRGYEPQLAQLEAGQYVTVQGICHGSGVTSVLIDDCTLL